MLTPQSSIILIVDDQPTNLKMLFSFLQESGYKVLVAKTGESAMNKLRHVSPDLILLDVMMPGLDGFETCQRLKGSTQTKDIPVMFMTALSESMDRIKGLKVGAVDYITKPLQQEEVLARIENQLKISRLQKQLEEQNQQLQQEVDTRRQIEERLKLVIQATNDGFWDWNLDSGELYISPRCKEMLGYSEEELPNEIGVWENLVFPEDRIVPLELVAIDNSGKFSRCESTQRFRHKDGSTIYILSRILQLKDARGRINRLIGAHIDTTEITTTLEALRHSRYLLAGVLNSSLDGVAVFSSLRDSQGNIVDFIWLMQNPAAEKIVGRQESELVGKQLLLEMPGHRETGMFEKFVRVVETGEPLETEFYYAHDAIRAWLQVVAVKLNDGFAVTFRDVTERKQMEDYNRALLHAIPDTMLRQHVDGTYLDIREKEGHPIVPANVIGRNLRDFPVLPAAVRQGILEHLQAAVETGKLQTYEYELQQPDGVRSYESRCVKSGADETIRIIRDVTDRKQAEERLRLLESAVVNANDAVIITEAEPIDLPGPRIVYVNEAFTRMTGYSKEEALGKTPRFLQGAKSDRATLDRIHQTLLTWQPIRVELINYRKDGSEFWVELEIVPVADEAGWFTHWVSVQRDITDRKLAQEALLLAQQRLEYLLFSSPSIIYSCQTTPPYTATFVSENISTVFGYEPQEFIEESSFWANHIHPEDRERIFAEVAQLLEVDDHAYEYRFLHKDGTYRWVLDALKLVRDEEGNPVECIGSMSDITQGKRTEERLRLLERAIAASNNGITISDAQAPDNPIIYVNSGFERLTGYSRDDVIGSNYRSFLQIGATPTALETVRCAITEGRETQLTLHSSRIDGSLFWNELCITPVRDTTGRLTHFIGVQTDISDRKQVEEALRRSEERLQLALEASGMGLWDWKINTGQIYFNLQWKAMLGYEVEEIENSFLSWERLIHPEDLPHVLEAINAHLEGNSPIYELEYRCQSKSGQWKWILSQGKVMERDLFGNPVRMTGTTIDMSDRKQAEEALRESEERFRTMADSTAVLLWVSGADSRCTFLNKTWLEFTGCNLEEELGYGWLNHIHPDERQRYMETYLNAFEVRESFQMEYRLLRFDGEYRWIVDLGKPRFTPNGSFAGYIGSCLDITERKQAEIEITTAKAALERQIQRVLLLERITQEIRSSLKPEQVFQTAATQIGQAFNVNRCLIHTYVEQPTPCIPVVAEYEQPGLGSTVSLEIPVLGNPYAQVVLTRDSALASDNVYADPLLEAACPLCHELGLKSMLTVRTSYQGKPNGAIDLHQYDRFRHWTEAEIELLESVAAQMGIAIAQANLLEQETQQRRELALQNHALEKAKQEAEAANRAKSQFLSKMSHELRTPLNAILGFTQVMARDDSLKAEQLEYLRIINRSGEHLLDLINDILSMSKIEAGQVTLNEHRFDLYHLLDSLEEMLRFKASSKGLQLLFERTPDVPQYVRTDESKLRQVLINLLGNAIKFTQTGKVTLRVFTSKQLATLVFEVKDTGPGIASDELGTLFDPFVQTETGRQSMEGTGLGLPISQQFVRLMGGDITARSTLGQGATFTFDVRVGLVAATDQKPISSKRRVIGLEPNQPSYRILIVEDAAVNRKLLVKILDSLGFEVRTATNGEEGVALWESWSPHLIWMDVIMPVMDGYEATQLIKQTPKGRDTVIIALTAGAFEEQRDAILRAGCDDFLPKPFKEEALLEKIAHHLGVRYVYEQQQLPASPQSPVAAPSLTSEALGVMPTSWVAQLHQAALWADDELMHELIEQIPSEHDFLRRALREILINFRLEELINLTEPTRS